MATPYLLIRREEVPSTQDVARAELDALPAQVVAKGQTSGRGRTGAGWMNAPAALATSIAFRADPDDRRPFSLVAGVAAVRAMPSLGLKWPNDLIRADDKLGGILVERTDNVVVTGLGLNLWWPDPPPGIGALLAEKPKAGLHAELAGIWGAEFLAIVESGAWPAQEFREACLTLGRRITWEPGGAGVARDVSDDGGLIVEMGTSRTILQSGAVRHVRPD